MNKATDGVSVSLYSLRLENGLGVPSNSGNGGLHEREENEAPILVGLMHMSWVFSRPWTVALDSKCLSSH